MTATADPVTAHVARTRLLLTLMSPAVIDSAVTAVATQGKDTSSPAIGRLTLIGTTESPRVALITRVTPKVAVASYLTDSGIRHGRTILAHTSHPIQFNSWPNTYREQAAKRWKAQESLQWSSDVNSYADRHYEWALKTQAVYRAITHCPWVAFAPIRTTVIPHAMLVMVPENGETT
jgi:hypothetical protein